MSEKEYIEATRRQIEAHQRVLAEAEAALDLEGRCRAAGFDMNTVLEAMSAVAAKASPEARAEAARQAEAEEERYRQARAQAISSISRTSAPAAGTAPRRPRNMA